jgi:hypothetical protein
MILGLFIHPVFFVGFTLDLQVVTGEGIKKLKAKFLLVRNEKSVLFEDIPLKKLRYVISAEIELVHSGIIV